MAVVIRSELSLGQLKRYLLHCARRTAPGNIQKRHETWCEIKAAMNCRNPKYSKAARGRAALRKISKRRETRRTPIGMGRIEVWLFSLSCECTRKMK